jgi:hypothetical protein
MRDFFSENRRQRETIDTLTHLIVEMLSYLEDPEVVAILKDEVREELCRDVDVTMSRLSDEGRLRPPDPEEE